MTSIYPAVLGGAPAFAPPGLPARDITPDWLTLEVALRGIHDRQYYTEHGPLVRLLEERLSQIWAGRHALCVANDTVAHLMLITALAPGRLWLPAALPWALAGARPWMGNLALATYDLSEDLRAPDALFDQLPAIPPGTTGPEVLLLACDEPAPRRMRLHREAAARSVSVVSHLACPGLMGADVSLPATDHVCVVSMRCSSLLQAGEGACILTSDPDLADRLRTMRASSGVQRHLPVGKTVNGRMSEAQAAIALLSLQRLPEHLAYLATQLPASLPQITGLRAVSAPQEPHLILEVNSQAFGLTRQSILTCLARENLHLPVPLWPFGAATPPQASRRLNFCLEIPPCIRSSQAEVIQLLAGLQQHAQQIRQALEVSGD